MKKHTGTIRKMSLVKNGQATVVKNVGSAESANDIFQDPRCNIDRRQQDMALLCPSPDRRRNGNRRKLCVINDNWWMHRRYTPLSYSSI